MTGIAEAVKAHTPLLVIAGAVPGTMRTSNFWIDQAAAVEALGAVAIRLESPQSASGGCRACLPDRPHRSHGRARAAAGCSGGANRLDGSADDLPAPPTPPAPSAAAVADLAARLSAAQRPVVLAGRGAFDARAEQIRLAEASGALLATTAMARGLFNGDPWTVDVMGGFATAPMAELIQGADVIVAFGASLNRWTTRNGELVGDASVVQVDIDRAAFCLHRRVDATVTGDAALTAHAVAEALEGRPARAWLPHPAHRRHPGLRTPLARPAVHPGDRRLAHRPPRACDRTGRPPARGANRLAPTPAASPNIRRCTCEVPDNHGYCLPLGFQCIGLSWPPASAPHSPSRTACRWSASATAAS